MQDKHLIVWLVFLVYCVYTTHSQNLNFIPITSPDDVQALKTILGDYPAFAETVPSWNFSNNAYDTSPCYGGNWVGITCNPVTGTVSTYTIVSITLAFTGYSGPLPPFELLRNLASLTFVQSGLTSIHENFFNSTSLRAVDFSFNNISGEIPTSLGSTFSPPLELLRLDFNELEGPIPDSLRNLNMSVFSANGNYLSEDIPPQLFTGPWQTSITKFSVSGNLLTGPIPSTIGNCTNLSSFVASGNQLTGSIPNLSNLTLVELLVSSNNLSGNLSGLNRASIANLAINQNNFTGPLPTLNINPQFIDVRCNQLSGAIPDIFKSPSGVQFAMFSVNNFTSVPDVLTVNQLYSLPEGLNYLNFSCNSVRYDWCGTDSVAEGQAICQGCDPHPDCVSFPVKLLRELSLADSSGSGVLFDDTVPSSSSRLWNWRAQIQM